MTTEPPRAPARPVELTSHGDTRIDPWYWLRDRDNPEVIAYLEAENRYTEVVLAPTRALQDDLFEEIRARVQETDVSPPATKGPWDYFTRTFEGKQYALHGRRPKGAADGEDETVLLDENELADGFDYFALGGLHVDPGQTLLAYSVDTDGGEEYELHIRDLTTGADRPDTIPGTYYGLAWSNDGRHLHYVRPDDAMRPFQVWRHTVGTDPAEDVLVYEEPDERFFVSIGRARSGRAILLSVDSKVSSEVYLLDPDDVTAPPRLVEARREDHEYDVEHHVATDGTETLVILTNADGATNFKVMTAPIATPGREHWRELVAHRSDVKIDGVDAFADAIVLSERAAGLEQLHLLGYPTRGLDRVVTMDDPAYSTWIADNLEFTTDHFRFGYTSLVMPTTAYDETFTDARRTLVKQTPVLGGFDPAQYVSARIWATASDGTQVPMSVVHRRDTPIDGTAPALLYGYGSYESSIDPTFSSMRLSLLDRGFVFAIAHIRGGGEMGRPWYEHGKLREKRNTFTDFIACAEQLCAAGYTQSDRLGARGGSAGGLLMGAAVNLRPDLFRAVIAEVPFVDVVTTMQDPELPLTVTEWEEWGDPLHDAADYEYMLSYSPYDNIAAVDHPAFYVTGGLNDPRVSYWEPAKYVAKLRVTTTGDHPILLKTEMGAGHGGPSGRYDVWRDEATVLAFLITELTNGAT